VVSTVRLRAVSPVASSSRLARLGVRLDAHRIQHVVGDVQLLAGVSAAALAAQPLPVEQMRAGELYAGRGVRPSRLIDSRYRRSADSPSLSRGADACFNPQRPLGRCHPACAGPATPAPPSRSLRHRIWRPTRPAQARPTARIRAGRARIARQAASRAAWWRPRAVVEHRAHVVSDVDAQTACLPPPRTVASISSDASVARPRQAARIISLYATGGFPVASPIRRSSSSSRRRCRQPRRRQGGSRRGC